MQTATTRNGVRAALSLFVLTALIVCCSTASFGQQESATNGSCSIAGGAYEVCDGNNGDGLKPLSATFILCIDFLGIPLPIDTQTGATFNFTGLKKDKTYYVFEVNPLGYLSLDAIPGPGCTKEGDDCIKVKTKEYKCYDRNCFHDCKIRPCIKVCKTVCPIAVSVGDCVTYTYTVKNTGNVPLCNIKAWDDKLGDLTSEFKAANGNCDDLKKGKEVTFYKCVKIDCAKENPIVNCVKVCGWFLLCKVEDCACVEVCIPVTISGGAFHDFECDGDPNLTDAPLNGATFTLTDLANNSVMDLFGNIVAPQVGSTFSFTNLKQGYYKVTETNPAGFNSTNAIPGPGGIKLDDDTIQVDAFAHLFFPNQNFLDCREGPFISVEKSADRVIASVGTNITYTFKVCNTGSVPLTGVTVVDDVLGDLTDEFKTANGGSDSLTPGQCVSFTVQYTVPDGVGLEICNNVKVTGTDVAGTVVEGTDGLCVKIEQAPLDRICYLPVTFTKDGWAAFCDPNNTIIKGGMIYNRFAKAFSCFSFCYNPAPGMLIVGGKHNISYTSLTSSLDRLCILLSQPCNGCGRLNTSLVNPWQLTPADGGGCLAVETIVLLMNVAYNDRRLMPRSPGYDLECFTLAKGLYKGKTVGEVFNIANALLAGDSPSKYGLPDCDTLVDILRQINANYEFVDFNTFNDRGYLIPNKGLGQPCPPHCPSVPMLCM